MKHRNPHRNKCWTDQFLLKLSVSLFHSLQDRCWKESRHCYSKQMLVLSDALGWQAPGFKFMFCSLLPHFPLNIYKSSISELYPYGKHAMFFGWTFLFLVLSFKPQMGWCRQSDSTCHLSKAKRGLISNSSIEAVNKRPCIRVRFSLRSCEVLLQLTQVNTHITVHTRTYTDCNDVLYYYTYSIGWTQILLKLTA